MLREISAWLLLTKTSPPLGPSLHKNECSFSQESQVNGDEHLADPWPLQIYLFTLLHQFRKTTLWIKRIEHRKWNRGSNGLRQLGQLVTPSILFPVFNPPYPQGTVLTKWQRRPGRLHFQIHSFFCRSTWLGMSVVALSDE